MPEPKNNPKQEDSQTVQPVTVSRPICSRCDEPIYGPAYPYAGGGRICYECADDLGYPFEGGY